jgi:DNA-binding XRE family transcriptional regulator
MKSRLADCIAAYNERLIPGQTPMTQSGIAAAIGVTEGAVSLWTAGKRSMQMESAFKIAQLLGCSVDDLFTLPRDLPRVNKRDKQSAA